VAKKSKIRDYNSNIIVAFSRSISLGLSNLWRNKFLSIATIIVIAVIIFIFNIILAIQFIGNQALRSLSERVDIVIYLRDDVEDYDAKQFTDELSKISGVKAVKFTSKEEALDIISKTHPKTADFLRKFDLKNPLPPSISITTFSAEDHALVQNFIEESDYKKMIQNYVSEESNGQQQILSAVAENLANISRFVRQLIFWIILVFVIGGTLVIVNAINLTIYYRRQEIHIMRLVGSTPNFIRTPFIFEGILYGAMAVLLSFIFLLAIGSNIRIESSNLWNYYETINLGQIFLLELILTILLAAVSSFIAAEQHIKGRLIMN
jgi:cell division transport system permease protein